MEKSIKKGEGLNASEKYLAKLCNRNFLSLWSFSNVYRDSGPKGNPGKELSDLLVVFGNYILIFSDKSCSYPETKDASLNWSRWFKRAVQESAIQLWGAEKWMRQYPKRIYLDQKCQQPFPFDIDVANSSFHLIVITHGVAKPCKKFFKGGSGSLMIKSDLKGFDAHKELFSIGDLDPTKTFVHVFDDTTLDIIMDTLDTITDFVSYLKKKEILLRSKLNVIATGEEDLLPSYLTRVKGQEHDFDFPADVNTVALGEGTWERFCKNPQRKAQIVENKISYYIDALIEKFNEHALGGTQHRVSSGGIKDSEKIMRFFAKESRFRRRSLAKSILGLVNKPTPPNFANIRFVVPLEENGVYYVLMTLSKGSSQSEEEYRAFRGEYLYVCCLVVRLVYPDAKDIVGFATEPRYNSIESSEDAIYFDGSDWNKKLEKTTKRLQKDLNILINPKQTVVSDSEFPDVEHKVRAKNFFTIVLKAKEAVRRLIYRIF